MAFITLETKINALGPEEQPRSATTIVWGRRAVCTSFTAFSMTGLFSEITISWHHAQILFLVSGNSKRNVEHGVAKRRQNLIDHEQHASD
jgi:hypothetical protein